MINISTLNPQSKIDITNKWIDGFTTSIFVTSGGGAFTGNLHDLTQLTFKGVLKRNGQETVLFQNTLKNLLIMSLLLNPLYYHIAVPTAFVNQNAGATTGIVPFRFDFGSPLNLIGDDKFTLEWQLSTTFFPSGSNISTSASYIQLDTCETTDIEYETPIFRSIVVEANQQDYNYSLGDNVMAIIFANYDKTDVLSTSAVINQMQLNSDKVNKQDNYNELITKAYSYYPTLAEADLRLQTFLFYQSNIELDNVNLNMQYNTTNVNSSKNFILVRSFVTSEWLRTRAGALENIRMASADAKGDFNPSLLQGKNSRN